MSGRTSTPFSKLSRERHEHWLAYSRDNKLTMRVCSCYSPLPRSHQALLAGPPRGPATRDEGAIQPEVDVDGFDTIDILGHEPDAIVWHRVLRQLGSCILAANDDG